MEAKLISDWMRLKAEIKDREAKLEQLRTIACKMMKKNQSDALVGETHGLVRSETKVTSVSKADLPDDIIRKYSKTSSRVTFRIVDLEKV
jgi:hypothetical protein